MLLFLGFSFLVSTKASNRSKVPRYMLSATVPPNSSNPFQPLREATKNILQHAFFLLDQKQNSPLADYEKLLKDNGWEKEDRKYIKIAKVFEGFSADDLSVIEPDTLFTLAKYNNKYARAIAKLKSGEEISQSWVRELMSDCNKPRQKKTKKSDTKQPDNATGIVESEPTFTETQVQDKIDLAIAEYENHMKEKRIAEYEEIYRSALQAVKDELQAAKDLAQQRAIANQELSKQIAELSQLKGSVNALVAENERLNQQVESLRYTLMMAAAQPSQSHTFTKEAEKVINKDLVRTIEPLSKGLEEKELEVAELKAVVSKQKEKIATLRDKSEQIISMFTSIADRLNWDGWSKNYCDSNGVSFYGLDAIAAFLRV